MLYVTWRFVFKHLNWYIILDFNEFAYIGKFLKSQHGCFIFFFFTFAMQYSPHFNIIIINNPVLYFSKNNMLGDANIKILMIQLQTYFCVWYYSYDI